MESIEVITMIYPCENRSFKNKIFIEKVMNILAKNHQNANLSHIEVAKKVFISHRHFHRKLIAATGMNFSCLLRRYRLNIALKLCHSDLQISQIAELVGFTSSSYFTKCFKAEFGVTPKQYQIGDV